MSLIDFTPFNPLQPAADEGPPAYQGYVEGDYVRIGAATGGTIDVLNVRRGDSVRPGDVVFILEQERESAAVREAAARLAEARYVYDNLRTGLRDPEIAVLAAQREQAAADLELAESELRRVRQLIQTNAAAAQRLDAAEAAVTRNTARVGEELDFTIFVLNSGDRALDDIVLVDTLPDRLTLIPESPAASLPADVSTGTADDGGRRRG